MLGAGAIIDDLEATTGIQADHWLWDQAVGVTIAAVGVSETGCSGWGWWRRGQNTDKALFNLRRQKINYRFKGQMNQVLEYIIKAKDETQAAVKGAVDRVKGMAASIGKT